MEYNYQSPLSIYIVWHPSFNKGHEVADFIYSTFCRDTNNPLNRTIGIPVYYRSHPLRGFHTPKEIPLNNSEYNAIILLIDDYFFNDDEWNSFIKPLIGKINANTRIFPIAFSKYAFSFEESKLGTQQYIDVKPIHSDYTEKEFIESLNTIRSRLLHDLCRLLLNKKPYSEAEEEEFKEPAPVRLFISHAKYDGEKEAKEFRNYVRANTKLNTFFDANDIADGYRFDKQIESAVKDGNAALVVFHSDVYASREWCQIEVLTAKRFKSPVVVVHNIIKGETRSFPYLGNVPTIKFLNNNFGDIIDLTLFQVLVNVFQKLNLSRIIHLYHPKNADKFEILSSPPELVNFPDLMTLKQQKSPNKIFYVVYPDPPLGNAELKLLAEMKHNIKFLTPVQLSSLIK